MCIAALPVAAADAGFGAAHQLVEPTLRAVGGSVLIDEGQVVVVERPEPFVPGDLLKQLLSTVAGEIDAEHAGVRAPARPAGAGGLAATRFDPFADLVTVDRRPRFRAGPAAPVPTPVMSSAAASAAASAPAASVRVAPSLSCASL